MSPVSPIPVILAVLTALLTTFVIMKRYGAPPLQGRFASIDGLRGYLAFFVYIHHSCIWYFYLQSGKWAVPPSAMYTHFGQRSVDIFFMITGFLFFTKILNGKSKPVDWLNLYVSRLLRLMPLYIFAIAMILIVVAYLSDFKINEPAIELTKNILRWFAFTITGAPDINGVDSTSIIIARVTWSLPYEWYFYLLLPVFALTVNTRPSNAYIFLSVLCIVFLTASKIEYSYLLIFSGGIIASFLSRTEKICQIAVKWPSSIVVIACLCIAILGSFHSVYKVIPLVLLTVAFSLIASGNTLFGALTSAVSRSLGEWAYSIYLLHGIVLFTVFKIILDPSFITEITPLTHWVLIFGITPILIFLSFLTFRFIEQPAMKKSAVVTAWFRATRKRLSCQKTA